jgi:uncharacterized protein
VGEPPRVVVDPNVLIPAAIAGGTPQRVVQLAVGAIRLIACPRLARNLDDVLARDRFLRWRTREQLDRFAGDIRALAQREPDPAQIPRITRDPNDDYLVALTRAAQADVLCSGDADLADVSDVTVLTPRQLLDRILGNQ